MDSSISSFFHRSGSLEPWDSLSTIFGNMALFVEADILGLLVSLFLSYADHD